MKTIPRTLEEIERLPKETLIATDICGYLDTDPGIIRWQAQHNPEILGFPVIVIKSRVKIPKEGFVNFCRHGRLTALSYDLVSEIHTISQFVMQNKKMQSNL